MNVILSIPLSEKNEAISLKNEFPELVSIAHSKKLIGAEDVIMMMIQVTTSFAPLLIDYLIKRKKENKKSSIKIDGIEVEYDTKEELELIIEKYLIEEKKEENNGD